MRTIPRQRLADGVVHDFVYEMVKTLCVGGRNIHTRTLTDMFQTVKDQYLLGAVFGFNSFRHCLFFLPFCSFLPFLLNKKGKPAFLLLNYTTQFSKSIAFERKKFVESEIIFIFYLFFAFFFAYTRDLPAFWVRIRPFENRA
jgi:hypothetical protein